MSEPALLSLRSVDAERARARSTADRRTSNAARAPDLEILDGGGILTGVPPHVGAGLPQRPASSWLKPAGAPPSGSVCTQTERARFEVPGSAAGELPLVISASSPRTRSNGSRKPTLQVRGTVP
jgi:hypothetical protein